MLEHLTAGNLVPGLLNVWVNDCRDFDVPNLTRDLDVFLMMIYKTRKQYYLGCTRGPLQSPLSFGLNKLKLVLHPHSLSIKRPISCL